MDEDNPVTPGDIGQRGNVPSQTKAIHSIAGQISTGSPKAPGLSLPLAAPQHDQIKASTLNMASRENVHAHHQQISSGKGRLREGPQFPINRYAAPLVAVDSSNNYSGVSRKGFPHRPLSGKFDSAMLLGAMPHGKRPFPISCEVLDDDSTSKKRRTKSVRDEFNMEERPFLSGSDVPPPDHEPASSVTSSLDLGFHASIRARGNPFCARDALVPGNIVEPRAQVMESAPLGKPITPIKPLSQPKQLSGFPATVRAPQAPFIPDQPPTQPRQVSVTLVPTIIDLGTIPVPGIVIESPSPSKPCTHPVITIAQVNPVEPPNLVDQHIIKPLSSEYKKGSSDVETCAIDINADAMDGHCSEEREVPKFAQQLRDPDSNKNAKDIKKKHENTRGTKPLSDHRFHSTKDQCQALKLLTHVTDLACVLSKKECRWLAEENWIFTCEQLSFSLGAAGKCDENYRKLQRKTASSPLIRRLPLSTEKIAPTIFINENLSTNGISTSIPSSLSPAVVIINQRTKSDLRDKPDEIASDDRNHDDTSGVEEAEATNKKMKEELGLINNQKAFQVQDTKMEICSLHAPKALNLEELDSMDTDGVDDLTSIVARATASYQSNPSGPKRTSTIAQVISANQLAESALMSHISHSSARKAQSSIGEERNGNEKTDSIPEQKDSVVVSTKLPCLRHPTADELKRASKLLDCWREALEMFFDGKGKADSVSRQFPINGPIACLFPKCLLNFLETIKVKSLFSFLSMKKTESSSLIPEYRAWRSHCGLSAIKSFPLARHLTGIAIRTEKAISAIPPVDEFTKKWMSTVLVMFTGSAVDFIIKECKVTEPSSFIEERTKEWSDRLVAWRDLHKMPVLKGSGKVAMISGWKTAVKESLEIERDEGRVLSDEEQMKELPADPMEALVPDKNKKLSRKPGKEFKAALYKDAEVALRSPDFLSSVLKSDNTFFLGSVGITTAEQLIDVEKHIDSDITVSLMKFRTELTKIPAHASTCVRLLYDWTQRVRAKLEEIQTDSSKDEITKKSDPKHNIQNKEIDSNETKSFDSKAKKHDSEIKGPPAKNLDSEMKDPPAKTRKKKDASERNTTVTKKSKKNIVIHQNPMDSLSASARRFFDTTSIKTAHDLLSTKTTPTAMAYAKWREIEGLPFLRGDGSIATISSWKAQVRKMAKALGDEELAATMPEGQVAKSTNKVPSPNIPPMQASYNIFPPMQARPVSSLDVARAATMIETELRQPTPLLNKEVLMGLPFQLFSVTNAEDHSLIYSFELSVRRSEDSERHQSIFLTFLGATQGELISNSQVPSKASKFPRSDEARVDILKERQVVNPDVDFSSSFGGTFSSQERGSGLLDLTSYGVGAISATDRVGDMRKSLLRFVLSTDEVSSNEMKVWEYHTNSNVLRRETARGSQFLFYTNEPMERGQVVELRYSKCKVLDCIIDQSDNDLRMYLLREISVLSFVDLTRLQRVLSEIQAEIGGDCVLHVTPQSKAALLVSRQRIHWLALKMLVQIEEVEKRSVALSNHRYDQFDQLKIKVKALLIDNMFREKAIESESLEKDLIVLALGKEIQQEIICVLEEKKTLDRPLDKRVWCKLARDLMTKSIVLVANYVVHHSVDMPDAQTRLATELCKCTVEAARQLASSDDENIHDFAFDALDSEYVEGDFDCKSKAVVAMEGIGNGSIIFIPVETAKTGNLDLDIGWYAEHQIFAVVAAVAECGLVSWMKDHGRPIYTRSTIRYAVKASITNSEMFYDESKQGMGIECLNNRLREINAVELPPGFSQVKNKQMPSAMPLFLGTIWPKLRNIGWRIDADIESIGEVSFIPPGQRSRAKRVNDRHRRLRDERRRKRARMALELQNIGLGYLSKTTKRLLIQSAGVDDTVETKFPVRKVVEMFLEDTISILSENNDEQRRRVKLIVGGIITCFEELYPIMAKNVDERAGSSYCDKNGAQKLIQLLVVLPEILHQAGLNLRQIEDSHTAIKDFLQFLSINYSSLFDEAFQLVKEEYEDDDGLTKRSLASHMARLSTAVDATVENSMSRRDADGNDETPVSEIIRDLVLPDDEQNLTRFQSLALRQMLPCRLSANDKRKKKNVGIGYPGIVCRHCLAANGEGKYFFSSFESLSTAGGVSWSHLVRCAKLPGDIKATLHTLRAMHADERKTLRHGAMSVYFARLWKRLHSSNTVGFSAFTVMKTDDISTPNVADGDTDQVEFGSHIEVLKFLQGDDCPISLKGELRECIEAYYRCMKQGGIIYATDVMPRPPRFFSSEYLLAKLAPGVKSSLRKHTSIG